MKKLAILGSTGSIGCSALSLVELYPERFEVVSLAAGRDAQGLVKQARKVSPRLVAIHDPSQAESLRAALPGVEVVSGIEGVVASACHPDVEAVVAGISGAAGLLPTFHALREGKLVALANKETLVMAGRLIMSTATLGGAVLLPVDSEHGALHQCLRGAAAGEVKRLILTASGGPFRTWTQERMESITVQDALNHPTWEMGRKITIDSATLMNKGLEVIEAHHLFGMDTDQIAVAIHPQSIVHSLVEFIDGNVLAQLSITDMRTAILYALSYPERWPSSLPTLDLFASSLEFFPPDRERFPCLNLAYQALRAGKTFPAALNAANEVAVEAFLNEQLSFAAISRIIDEVLQQHEPLEVDELEPILEADRQARRAAFELISCRSV